MKHKILLICTLILTIITVHTAHARVRAMNFFMDKLEWDIVEAGANGRACIDPVRWDIEQNDSGTMIFQATVNQTMIDQFYSMWTVNGSVEVVYQTNTAFSLAGRGTGKLTGSITVAVNGNTINTHSVDMEGHPGGGGTFPDPQRVRLDLDMLIGMMPGETITVTATGMGQAMANGCIPTDQAITTWYFSSGGKPFIATSPY